MASTVDIPQQILLTIEKDGFINSLKYSQTLNEPHQKIVGGIKSLQSLGNVIDVEQKGEKTWECTEEGVELAQHGSHEARLMATIPTEGRSVNDIKANFPNCGVAMGAALKNKWVKKSGDNLLRAVDVITDQVQVDLQVIINGRGSELDSKLRGDYKKRKLIKEIDINLFEVRPGPSFTTTIAKQEAELTKEMIENGSWKGKDFKPFNFKAKGKLEHRSGHLHPLMQMRAEFRQIFLEMGFTEMPTNCFVESAFWNFDSLFQPQQHPARDAHDTFYVSDPGTTINVPEDYLQRVSKTHSCGGYGSVGYNYDWSRDEAHKNLLRTHTTAVSARMLYKLAQDGFHPVKYFSIDRVFRNETLDATHLAEFHQIEGVVADYNLSIKNLMGLFTAFFEKIGISRIKFKPTYNPYTEPSMEIFSFHEGLNKWVEVGNSGIFRPEMLRPMGLPENVTVIAWGLSLERPTMIKCGINNIRELVGPKVKMELILDNPVCTVDKFKHLTHQLRTDTSPPPSSPPQDPTIEALTRRQEVILDKLSLLQTKVLELAGAMGVSLKGHDDKMAATEASLLTGHPNPGIAHNIVVHADPRRPPYSLRSLIVALADAGFYVYTTVHSHSSVKDLSVNLKNFFNGVLKHCTDYRGNSDVCLTLVWHQEGDNPSNFVPKLAVSPLTSCKVRGEHNICRYLARLSELKCPDDGHRKSTTNSHLYESLGSIELVTLVDHQLDLCQTRLVMGTNKDRSCYMKYLEETLSKHSFICGMVITVADIVVLSTIYQLRLNSTLCNVTLHWMNKCLDHPWGKAIY